MQEAPSTQTPGRWSGRAPLALFLGCGLLLGAALVCGFAIAYGLLRDHPGHAPELIRPLYALLVAGLVALVVQAGVVVLLLARPLREASQRLSSLSAALERHSHRDTLTGALNRTSFEHLVVREMEALRRYGAGFCALLVDVDGFRALNERLGFEAGDQALADLAALIRGHMRKADLLFRWRSGRFMVLASGIGQEQGERFADKLRDLAAGHEFRQGLRLTLCVGVAQAEAEDTPEVLVGRVKAALGQAKALGPGSVAGPERLAA